MNYPQKELIETAQIVHASISKLSSEEGSQVINKLVENFARNNGYFLWEYLKDSVAIQNDESWRWISEYVEEKATILFFNSTETNSVFSFQNGSQIVPVLEHMPPCEFYLTNTNTEYLICFNHHDYLIASGAARAWLEQKIHASS